MDLEKVLVGLPDDAGEALFVLNSRLERQLDLTGDDEISYMQACAVLSAYYAENGLKAPKALSYTDYFPTAVLPGNKIGEANSVWRRRYLGYREDILSLKYKAQQKTASLALRKKEGEFGYAILTPEGKQEIHASLDAIRKIVAESDLDDRKKNAINQRLSALAAEVDRNGTQTDRFFAFMIDLGYASGEMAKRGKPALDEARKILDIVMRSRAKNEGVQLPPPENFPQLPGPSDS